MIVVGSHRAVLLREDGTLRDVARICTIARASVERKPKAPEDLINWICEDSRGWLLDTEPREWSGDLQLYLTWISGRKDFEASVWDARNNDLMMYWQGPTKELCRGGREYDRLVGSRRSIGSEDVTAEMMATLSGVRT